MKKFYCECCFTNKLYLIRNSIAVWNTQVTTCISNNHVHRQLSCNICIRSRTWSTLALVPLEEYPSLHLFLSILNEIYITKWFLNKIWFLCQIIVTIRNLVLDHITTFQLFSTIFKLCVYISLPKSLW